MKGSIIIILFFIAGVTCGIFDLISISVSQSGSAFYALLVLMTFVGISIGNDTDTLRKIRRLNPRLMCLPVFTIIGTIIGSLCAAVIFNQLKIFDSLAIGSGLGYYSLSSIFISKYKGAELGSLALLTNIAREIITLLGAPILMRFFGPLAPIASGGATSMDTTLPIIVKVSGKKYTMLSIYHGMFCDFSVPFLVIFFCSF